MGDLEASYWKQYLRWLNGYLIMAEGGIIPDKLVSVLCFDGSPITASFISNKINSHIKGNPIKSISVGE